jgi:predicted GNAT family acetyltransferase
VTTLEDRVLLEKKPDNQMVLSYVDKIEKYIQQRYEASKEIIIDRNKKKLENWLELRKEEYLLKTKDTSELDAIRARYETETDFRQKIELKKQIEDFEKKQQQLINLFHSEMTLMEEEAAQMQQEFVKNILKTPRLATKIVIKF